MQRHEILTRWVAIESGNGIENVRKTSHFFSIAAFTVCVAVGLVYAFFDLPSLVFEFPGALIGWLIAERNALESRIAQWPTFRQYIDWTKVREDLRAQGTSQRNTSSSTT